MPKQKTTKEEEYKQVEQYIRDYIEQNRKFPSITQISRGIKLSKAKTRRICDELVKRNQLSIVFKEKNQPTLYAPTDIMKNLFTPTKPDWLLNYTFENEKALKDTAKQLEEFEMFRKLLYASGIQLEEAVASTFNYLGFHNVLHHKENTDGPDITFDHEGKKVLVEVQGTSRAGDKSKVLQLDGWIEREINRDTPAEKLQGIFVVNHYKEEEPNSRSEPLTKHAKEFLKRYNFKFLTTKFLFNVTKDLIEKKRSTEDARKLVWEGEKYD